MRIAYHYGSIAPGGVERRMGDLYRELTRRGDDVWFVALRFDPGGIEMLCGQGGVPTDRVVCAPEGMPFDNAFREWSIATLAELDPDIIDAQWCAFPVDYPYPSMAVATIHGAIPFPEPELFDGVLFVSKAILEPMDGLLGPVRAVENWVDLDAHPFNEELPEGGVCFLGRECKTENADAIARDWTGEINCYAETWEGVHPPNMVYQGHGDPREVFPQYRVCFTSGLAAMESIAAGRLTIMGRSNLYNRGDYRLVTPERIAGMARGRFAERGTLEDVAPPPTKQRKEEFARALEAGDYLDERRYMRAYLATHHDATTQIGLVRDFYEEVLV